MKINIVCDDYGWVYDKFVKSFQKYSSHTIVRNSKEKCDVTHYIPYYSVTDSKHILHPCTAWFSHRESKDPLKSKFLSAAQIVDVAISHSAKYATWLRDQGQHNVIQLIPGVDLERFKLRGQLYRKNLKILSVGYVGRSYSSSARKNPKLLDAVSRLNYIDLRTTGGKMSTKQIPAFYQTQDLIISPATTEGGPMCIQESLASGVPVICYEDVGVANEFNDGIIRVPFNDTKAFIKRIKEFLDNKEYEWYGQEGVQKQMRAQVEGQTWEKFVYEHDKVWEMIVTDTWRKSK